MNLSLETLPPEQSGQSLKFVRPPHLCNLALTSSKMRELADNPKLWSGMRVKKEKIKQEGFDQLFSINRFKKIRKIDLSNMTFTNEELQRNLNAIKSSSVKDLNLKNVDVSKVPPVLLAQTASQVNTINLGSTLLMGSTNLTTEQSISVLETCISSDNLVDVSLAYSNLCEVEAELLGRAAHHLQKINLDQTTKRNLQCIAVFKACISSDKLVDVSLAYSDLREVPAELLGEAAKHLHKINLDGTRKTNLHCLAVLEACISSEKLVDVSLALANLCEVPAELLGRAAHHLYNIDLDSTDLDTEQCIAVLEACVSSAKLVEVSLTYSNLSGVPAELLGQAAHHLHKIDLARLANTGTDLDTAQCLAVLEACISSVKLVDVSLKFADLHNVPPELLGRAAHHLQKIDLTFADLNTEHCISVLEACVSSSNLVDVSLVFADLREVPAELLERAAKHLHRMNLRSCNLTNEQCIAVLEACISSDMLVEVSFEKIYLGAVPAELLARASSVLKR